MSLPTAVPSPIHLTQHMLGCALTPTGCLGITHQHLSWKHHCKLTTDPTEAVGWYLAAHSKQLWNGKSRNLLLPIQQLFNTYPKVIPPAGLLGCRFTHTSTTAPSHPAIQPKDPYHTSGTSEHEETLAALEAQLLLLPSFFQHITNSTAELSLQPSVTP